MRVVLDTNLIASGAISPFGFPAQILRAWDFGSFDLLVSPDLLGEYRRALSYDRVQRRHNMTTLELNRLLHRYESGGVLVKPEAVLSVVVADPDDDRVLECAIAGDATHIVNGDAHLLALGTFRQIPILTARAFVELLEALAVSEQEL